MRQRPNVREHFRRGNAAKPPAAVTLDIDDTCDVVHGQQQLSLFNAHHDDRCFLPIHAYDTATSHPVAVILRPGKTPSGREVRSHLRRLIRAIRRNSREIVEAARRKRLATSRTP